MAEKKSFGKTVLGQKKRGKGPKKIPFISKVKKLILFKIFFFFPLKGLVFAFLFPPAMGFFWGGGGDPTFFIGGGALLTKKGGIAGL